MYYMYDSYRDTNDKKSYGGGSYCYSKKYYDDNYDNDDDYDYGYDYDKGYEKKECKPRYYYYRCKKYPEYKYCRPVKCHDKKKEYDNSYGYDNGYDNDYDKGYEYDRSYEKKECEPRYYYYRCRKYPEYKYCRPVRPHHEKCGYGYDEHEYKPEKEYDEKDYGYEKCDCEKDERHEKDYDEKDYGYEKCDCEKDYNHKEEEY